MEDPQSWRRNARRHVSQRVVATTATGPGPVRRPQRAPGGVSAPTASSMARNATRTRPTTTEGPPTHGESAPTPPSRWKELRQSIRIKATMDTDDRRPRNARIADLCEEDRDKVAKLIRRIVDVSALHEQREAEFTRQQALLETEIHELRAHVKKDARELEELGDRLRSTLTKLREYQERVLVLEETNDHEVKHRMETDQTMDLLKHEVDKLRELVRRQKDEMATKEQEQAQTFKVELDRVTTELRVAQEQLLQERKDRLLEKQRELEARLARNATSPSPTAPSAVPVITPPTMATIPMTSGDERVASAAIATSSPRSPSVSTGLRQSAAMDTSSVMNTSTELPHKIKEIMDEWKQRMEEALTGRSDSEPAVGPATSSSTVEATPRTTSRGCQTEQRQRDDLHREEVPEAGDDEEMEDQQDDSYEEEIYETPQNPIHRRPGVAPQRGPRRQLQSAPRVRRRRQFDKLLVLESDDDLDTPRQVIGTQRQVVRRRDGDDSVAREPIAGRQQRPPSPRVTRRPTRRRNLDDSRPGGDDHEDDESRRVSRVLMEDFAHPSIAEETFDDEVQSTIELLDAMDRNPTRGLSDQLGLYESSLLEVVEAVETGARLQQQQQASTRTRSQRPQRVPSPRSPVSSTSSTASRRFQSLREGLQAREQKLAWLSTQHPRPEPPTALMEDVELFQQVQDLYERDLGLVGPSDETNGSYGAPECEDSQISGSECEDAVREAIERDMVELLRDQAFQGLLGHNK